MGYDKNFSLSDFGICPRCNGVGSFYTSGPGSKKPGSPFEKCTSCDVINASRRPPGYQPPAFGAPQQQAYPAPNPPPQQQQQQTRNVYLTPQQGGWQQQQPQPTFNNNSHQQPAQAVVQSTPCNSPAGNDEVLFQLAQQVGDLTGAINHLTNALHEFSENNNGLLKAMIQALDAMSIKLGNLDEQYDKMQ